MAACGHRTAGRGIEPNRRRPVVKARDRRRRRLWTALRGQIITRPDALELAAALERALIDIPDVPKAKELIEKQTAHMSEWVTPSSSVFERSAASREYLKHFIIHCRDCGEFWLY